jgi:hypothetical protein
MAEEERPFSKKEQGMRWTNLLVLIAMLSTAVIYLITGHGLGLLVVITLVFILSLSL